MQTIAEEPVRFLVPSADPALNDGMLPPVRRLSDPDVAIGMADFQGDRYRFLASWKPQASSPLDD